MNKQNINLKDSFLVAMPNLKDSEHKDALIYLCHHGEYGSMGIILNKAYDMDLKTMLGHLDISANEHMSNQDVFRGGNIQSDRGFVLHPFAQDNDYIASYKASDELSLTSSTDILEDMALGKGPKQAIIALGYISWAPGKLESEIMDNLWLNCPSSLEVIFNVNSKDKMQAAASLIGVNLAQLTSHSGQA